MRKLLVVSFDRRCEGELPDDSVSLEYEQKLVDWFLQQARTSP